MIVSHLMLLLPDDSWQTYPVILHVYLTEAPQGELLLMTFLTYLYSLYT